MKTNFYKTYRSVFAVCIMIILGVWQNANAQVTLYDENFDNVTVPTLPTGWTATTGGWMLDSVSSNASTGYTGASGHNDMAIENVLVLVDGDYELESKSISTIGYDSISVMYGNRRTKHFTDSGSIIKSFSWSVDGGTTWDSIPFTRNPNDSYWHLANDSVRMLLPAGADNQSSVMFQWMMHIHHSSGGTYRIDDFNVQGKAKSSGLNMVNSTGGINAFPNPASGKITIANSNDKNYIILLTDVTGKVLKTIYSANNQTEIDLSGFQSGFYFAEVINENNTAPSRVVKIAVVR